MLGIQADNAAAAVFAQASEVPAPTCVKPVLPPADQPLSDAAATRINTESKAYVECAAAYHAARKAAVDQSNETIRAANATAQANVDAAKKMQSELDAFLAELNANADARQPKAKKDGK